MTRIVKNGKQKSFFFEDYIETNFNLINNDMNRINSTAKNRKEKSVKTTRKKREELSISASKSIKKEQVEIIVDFK